MTKRLFTLVAALVLAATGLAASSTATASPAPAPRGAAPSALPPGANSQICEVRFTPVGFVSYQYGDVNRDGAVSSFDAYLAWRLKQEDSGIAALFLVDRCADVNLDGRIAARDADLISRYAAGLIDRLPVVSRRAY